MPTTLPSKFQDRPGPGAPRGDGLVSTYAGALAEIRNAKHRRFVQEYLVDLDGAKAAVRAGFKAKNAATRAWHLLRRPEIQKAIGAGQEEMAKRSGVRAESVLQDYLDIAGYDVADVFEADGNTMKNIHDIPKATRKAISEIRVFEEFAGTGEDRRLVGYTKHVKFYDRPKALEALGRHLGLFNADQSNATQILVVLD